MLKMRKSWSVKRNKWVFLLILVPVLAITIGYSLLELTVTSVSNITVGNITWGVRIVPESVNFTDTSDENYNDESTITLSDDGKTITWNGVLGEVGETVCINFAVENSGTIPVDVTITNNGTIPYGVKTYFGFKSATYSNSYYHGYIKKNNTTIPTVCYYLEGSTATLEALSGQSLSLSFTVNIKQNSYQATQGVNINGAKRFSYNPYAVYNNPSNSSYDNHAYTNRYKKFLIKNEEFTLKKAYDENGKLSIIEGIDESIVIPVIPGDHIKASSFGSKDSNGSEGTTDGVFITYLNNNTIVSRKSAEEVYEEFSTNGYLTVPDGVDAVNVPYYTNSTRNFYILNP